MPNPFWRIIEGDCRDTMSSLDAGSVQTCVTSPPYYGLRDYGLPPSKWADGWVGCLGLEPTPKDLIGIPWMVAFALRADGWYLRSDIVWSKPSR